MKNSDAALLNQLHDIHLPDPLGIWPLAPGWLVLITVVIASLVAIIGWGWYWHRHGKVKRAALRMLAEYEATYRNTSATQSTTAAINELLKRVALAYFPRERVANLYGRDWLLFLNQTSKQLDFLSTEDALLVWPYQAGQGHDLQRLFYLAREWIKQRRTPCLV